MQHYTACTKCIHTCTCIIIYFYAYSGHIYLHSNTGYIKGVCPGGKIKCKKTKAHWKADVCWLKNLLCIRDNKLVGMVKKCKKSRYLSNIIIKILT